MSFLRMETAPVNEPAAPIQVERQGSGGRDEGDYASSFAGRRSAPGNERRRGIRRGPHCSCQSNVMNDAVDEMLEDNVMQETDKARLRSKQLDHESHNHAAPERADDDVRPFWRISWIARI